MTGMTSVRIVVRRHFKRFEDDSRSQLVCFRFHKISPGMGLLGGNSTKSVKTSYHQRRMGQPSLRQGRYFPVPPVVPSSFPYGDYNSSYKTFQVL